MTYRLLITLALTFGLGFSTTAIAKKKNCKANEVSNWDECSCPKGTRTVTVNKSQIKCVPCCKANTAKCMSCSAGQSVGSFCKKKPKTKGCPMDVKPNGKRVPGHWGTWAKKIVRCKTGSYAYAFRIRAEKKRGKGDDSALNAIQLRCRRASDNHKGGFLQSREGKWGKWSKFVACPKGQFITSFALKVEKKQGRGDDSAANDVRFHCSGGASMRAKGGLPWGKWQKGQTCPKGSYVNGFRTRVEGPKARRTIAHSTASRSRVIGR